MVKCTMEHNINNYSCTIILQLIFIIIICNTCYYSLTWILLQIKCCSSFSQHTRGSNKVRKNRSACYRQNWILETSLNRYRQQVNMYRKPLTRLRKKITPTNGDTPRSKTRKLLILRIDSESTPQTVRPSEHRYLERTASQAQTIRPHSTPASRQQYASTSRRHLPLTTTLEAESWQFCNPT